MPIRDYQFIRDISIQDVIADPDLALMQDLATFQAIPAAFTAEAQHFAYDTVRLAACMTSGTASTIIVEKVLPNNQFVTIVTFSLDTVGEVVKAKVVLDASVIFRVRKAAGDGPAWVRGW